MSQALIDSGRDIVYSLPTACPSNTPPTGRPSGQRWRTTGDIRDTWRSLSGIGFAPGQVDAVRRARALE